MLVDQQALESHLSPPPMLGLQACTVTALPNFLCGCCRFQGKLQSQLCASLSCLFCWAGRGLLCLYLYEEAVEHAQEMTEVTRAIFKYRTWSHLLSSHFLPKLATRPCIMRPRLSCHGPSLSGWCVTVWAGIFLEPWLNCKHDTWPICEVEEDRSKKPNLAKL